jgi:hypothetical protein
MAVIAKEKINFGIFSGDRCRRINKVPQNGCKDSG